MALKYQPFAGQIFRCDFNGLEKGEMAKSRPVIVVCPKPRINKSTRVVVCLSTTAPDPIMPYHMEVALPEGRPEGLSAKSWVKSDMVYSVSLKRLSLYLKDRDRRTGKRVYHNMSLDGESVFAVRQAVATALGLP